MVDHLASSRPVAPAADLEREPEPRLTPPPVAAMDEHDRPVPLALDPDRPAPERGSRSDARSTTDGATLATSARGTIAPPRATAASRDDAAATRPERHGPAAADHRAPMAPRPPMAPARESDDTGAAERGGATGPQLRRFIKSRAYVPMHELRRRFAINGNDDDVTPVDVDKRRVFVGLPDREGRLLGELLRGGDIGYELSMDPITPIVVGVYPMRPVTRP